MSTGRTPTLARPDALGTPERFAARTRADRRRRWRRRGLLLVVVAGLGTAAWVLGWSGLLGVRTIEVVGAQRASDGLVTLTAGVALGTPLARVDPGSVEERVGGLRVVADVTVERVWPRTLRITVQERQAMAVARRGDALRLVDSEGVDYANTEREPRALPLLDLDLDLAQPDEVTAGLAVVAGLPRDLARRVAAVEVGSPDDVRLRLRSGSIVFWGDVSATEQKAEVLTALLRQRADRYDVRAPEAPTTVG